jgi:hypothetical protein
MDLMNSPKSFKSLKIRFESSTVAFTNLTTFGGAVGALYWILKMEFKNDTNYLNIYIEL